MANPPEPKDYLPYGVPLAPHLNRRKPNEPFDPNAAPIGKTSISRFGLKNMNLGWDKHGDMRSCLSWGDDVEPRTFKPKAKANPAKPWALKDRVGFLEPNSDMKKALDWDAAERGPAAPAPKPSRFQKHMARRKQDREQVVFEKAHVTKARNARLEKTSANFFGSVDRKSRFQSTNTAELEDYYKSGQAQIHATTIKEGVKVVDKMFKDQLATAKMNDRAYYKMMEAKKPRGSAKR